MFSVKPIHLGLKQIRNEFLADWFKKIQSNQMKAIVYQQYGSSFVLKLKEVDKPVPKDDEVLINELSSGQ